MSNKSTMVKKILGKVLLPAGFRYNKAESVNGLYVYDRLIVNKRGEDDIQKVFIQQSNFSKSFMLRLEASERSISKEPYQFVPDFRDIDFKYETDEDFVSQVKRASEIMTKYGFQQLEIDESSESNDSDKLPVYAYMDVLVNHRSIAKNYMKKEKIPDNLLIEEVDNLVMEKLKPFKGKPMSEVGELLIALSSYYGFMLQNQFNGYWAVPNCRGSTGVVAVKFTNLYGKEISDSVLGSIKSAWSSESDEHAKVALNAPFEKPTDWDIRLKMDAQERHRLTKEYGMEKIDILSKIDDSAYIEQSDSVSVLVNHHKLAEAYMDEQYLRGLSIKEIEKFVYEKIKENREKSFETLSSEKFFMKLGAYYGTMLQRHFVGYWSYDEKDGFGRSYVNFKNESGRELKYPPIKAVLCAWLKESEGTTEEANRYIHLPFEKLSALEKKIINESITNGYKAFKKYFKGKNA